MNKQWELLRKYIFYIAVFIALLGLLIGLYFSEIHSENIKKQALLSFADEKAKILEISLDDELSVFNQYIDRFLTQNSVTLSQFETLALGPKVAEYIELKQGGNLKSVGDNAYAGYCKNSSSGSDLISSNTFKGLRATREVNDLEICFIFKSKVIELWESSNRNDYFNGHVGEDDVDEFVVQDKNVSGVIQKVIDIDSNQILVYFESNKSDLAINGLWHKFLRYWPFLSLLALGLLFHMYRLLVKKDIHVIEDHLLKIAKGNFGPFKYKSHTNECMNLFKIMPPVTNAIQSELSALEDRSMIDRVTGLPNKIYFKKEVERLLSEKNDGYLCLIKFFKNDSYQDYSQNWFLGCIEKLSNKAEQHKSLVSFVSCLKENEVCVVMHDKDGLNSDSIQSWVMDGTGASQDLIDSDVLVIKSVKLDNISNYPELMTKLDKTIVG